MGFREIESTKMADTSAEPAIDAPTPAPIAPPTPIAPQQREMGPWVVAPHPPWCGSDKRFDRMVDDSDKPKPEFPPAHPMACGGHAVSASWPAAPPPADTKLIDAKFAPKSTSASKSEATPIKPTTRVSIFRDVAKRFVFGYSDAAAPDIFGLNIPKHDDLVHLAAQANKAALVFVAGDEKVGLRMLQDAMALHVLAATSDQGCRGSSEPSEPSDHDRGSSGHGREPWHR